jgi:proton glutamate symport protein
MKKNKINMVTQIMIAVVLGVVFGLLFGDFSKSLKVIGDIFLRLIQMSIPLLVFGQIIEAVARLNPKEVKGLGTKTIVVFAVSSLLAAFWGILMALIFSPGSGINIQGLNTGTKIIEQNISINDTLMGFFPSNIIGSLANGSIIQIIVFALIFGIAFSKFRTSNEESHLLTLLTEFNEIIIKLITIIMYIAPIGIFALIASIIGQLGISVIMPLIKYLGVYSFATFSFLIVWISVVSSTCKLNPLRLIKNMTQMSIMALVTTSSAITLPLEMEDAEKKLGIGNRVTKLVLPLGMSLNSNGSAMHMALTVVTIAQIYGIQYGMSKILYIGIIAALVSLANAVVPGAGLVSLAIIVPQMGLPLESIALFAGVEWFVGMLRTILNVDSDVFSAILVAKHEKQINYDIFYGKSPIE